MFNAKNLNLPGLSTLLKSYDPASQESIDAITKWYNESCNILFPFITSEHSAFNSSVEDICLHIICNHIFYLLDDFDFACSVSEFMEPEISELSEQLEFYLKNAEKPLLEREFSLPEKQTIVHKYSDDSILNTASDDEVALYRRLAFELCEENDCTGLKAVAYGTYSSNRAFETDFETSRKCLHKLMETHDNFYSQIFYANSLGYIYYYGRTNNGVPQYDEAFKYFTFAANGGVYEARYKLADMYKNGYGTIQSDNMYRHIITELYDENLQYILDGRFDCKFADIALRMGNISYEDYADSYYFEPALVFYMQADFAIRMRMMARDYYGDTKVLYTIQQSIEKVKSQADIKLKKSHRSYNLFYLLEDNLKFGRKMTVDVKKQKSSYKLTFRMHKDSPKATPKRIFVSIPAFEICGLFDKISVTVKTEAQIETGTFIFDKVYIDCFDLNGNTVLSLPDDSEYIIKRSSLDKNKSYRFISVSFGQDTEYDYRCDNENIKVGDRVLVKARGEEKVAQVTNSFSKTESELSLPLKAYSFIIDKI